MTPVPPLHIPPIGEPIHWVVESMPTGRGASWSKLACEGFGWRTAVDRKAVTCPACKAYLVEGALRGDRALVRE